MRILPKELVLKLNAQISYGNLKHKDGSIVEDPIEEGAITEDIEFIHPIIRWPEGGSMHFGGDSSIIPIKQLGWELTCKQIEEWENWGF